MDRVMGTGPGGDKAGPCGHTVAVQQNSGPMTRLDAPPPGDARRIPPDARLECRICWHVYDPAEGDPVWQIPSGTPFAELPAHWRCPNCDAAREQFLVLDA